MSHANGDNLTTTVPSTTKGIRKERSRLHLGTSRRTIYDSTVPPPTLPAVPQRHSLYESHVNDEPMRHTMRPMRTEPGKRRGLYEFASEQSAARPPTRNHAGTPFTRHRSNDCITCNQPRTWKRNMWGRPPLDVDGLCTIHSRRAPPARKIISHGQNVGETARKPASNPHTAPSCALRVNRTEDEGTYQPEPSTMWAGRT